MKENITRGISEFLEYEPKRDFVQKYISLFDEKQMLQEDTIQRVIDMDRTNLCLPSVMAKVVIINSLYSTFLNTNNLDEAEFHGDNGKKRTLSVGHVASHIVEMARTRGLDEKIQSGSANAVEMIREVCGDDWKSIYSFATKYCNWLNQEAFSIVDKYTRGILYYTNLELDERFYDLMDMKNDMQDYYRYCDIITNFKQKFGFMEFTAKEIDKFLWMFGKRYFISYD